VIYCPQPQTPLNLYSCCIGCKKNGIYLEKNAIFAAR
jgi:hypothetical protein